GGVLQAGMDLGEGRLSMESLQRQGLGFDPARLKEFFALVPRLYAAEQKKVQAEYQGLLYSVEHPLQADTTDRIDAAFHLPHPKWTPENRRQGIDALDGLRYPDTRPLAKLR